MVAARGYSRHLRKYYRMQLHMGPQPLLKPDSRRQSWPCARGILQQSNGHWQHRPANTARGYLPRPCTALAPGYPDVRIDRCQSCTAQSCQQATIAEASEVWRATGVPCQLRQCGRASRTISADASCRDDKANPRSTHPSVVAAIAASQASAISREIGKGMTSPAEPVSATLERIVFRATRSGASACTSLRPCSFSAPPVSTVTDDKLEFSSAGSPDCISQGSRECTKWYGYVSC